MKRILNYGLMLGAAMFVFWVLYQITAHFDFAAFKRAFYVVAFMWFCFYVVCAVRAVAKFFEAKAAHLAAQTEQLEEEE